MLLNVGFAQNTQELMRADSCEGTGWSELSAVICIVHLYFKKLAENGEQVIGKGKSP